jgi:hypothetical protein
MILGPTSRVPGYECPCCKRMLDGAAAPGADYVPSEGDITICLYCATILEYSQGMALQMLTEAKKKEIDSATWIKLGRMQTIAIGIIQKRRETEKREKGIYE